MNGLEVDGAAEFGALRRLRRRRRDVIFFLLKLFFTHDSRTLPGFAPPGVGTTLLFGDQLAVCDVRLRAIAEKPFRRSC